MSDPYKSEDAQIVFGNESTQGTTVTPDHHIGGIDDDATPPDPEQEWLVRRYIGGDREPSTKHSGQRTYEGGSIPVEVWDGRPLAWLLGKDATTSDTALDSSGSTTSSTGDTLHTLTAKMDGSPPTKTMEATYYGRGGGSDFTRHFGGVMPASGEIELQNDGVLLCSLELWAMNVNPSASAASVAMPSREALKFSDIEANLSMFNQTFAELTGFTLEVENNPTPGRYIEDTDGVDPSRIHYGNIDYSFQPTIEVTDDTIYKELINRSNPQFDSTIQLKNGDGYQARFEIGDCDLENAPHEVPGDSEPIEVDASVLPESLTVKFVDPNEASAYI